VFSVNFALDRIFASPARKVLWKRIVDTLLMLIAVTTLFVASTAFSLFINYAETLPSLQRFTTVRWFLTGPAPYAIGVTLSAGLLFLLYMITPQRRPDWKRALAGAIIGGVLWELVRGFIGDYLAYQSVKYKELYGSLAAVIFVIVWAYFFSISLVAGACATEALKAHEDEQVL
jgi:membrane protein